MHRVIDIGNEMLRAGAKAGEDFQSVALEHDDIRPFFPGGKSFVISWGHMNQSETRGERFVRFTHAHQGHIVFLAQR